MTEEVLVFTGAPEGSGGYHVHYEGESDGCT